MEKETIQELALIGAMVNEDSGDLTGRAYRVSMIEQGWNSTKTRYYTDEFMNDFVRAGTETGISAMADHQSFMERMEKPVGSVKEIIGWYTDLTYNEDASAIESTLNLLMEGAPYPSLPKAIKESHERGNPSLYQLSIAAVVKGKKGEMEGHKGFIVDGVDLILSTDVVTIAGAGGSINAVTENKEIDMADEETTETTETTVADEMKSMSPEELKAAVEVAHPGLLEGTEDTTQDTRVTVDVDVSAVKAEREALETTRDEVKAEREKLDEGLEEYKTLADEAARSQLVTQAITEATGLPEAVRDRIKDQVEKGTIADVEALAEAIKSERDVYRSIIEEQVPELRRFNVENDGEPRGLDQYTKALTGMVAGTSIGDVEPFTSIHEAYYVGQQIAGKPYTHMSPAQIASNIIRETWLPLYEGEDDPRRANEADQGIRSTSFGVLLGDSMNKAFLMAYEGLDDEYGIYKMLISTMREVERTDIYPYSGLGNYEEIPVVDEGGTYEPGPDVTEREIQLRIRKRGRTLSLTKESLANDDLNKLQRLPVRLASAAIRTRFYGVFDLFQQNSGSGPQVYEGDTDNLISTNHNNTFSSFQQLGYTALETAWKMMRRQLDQDASRMRLYVTPKYLLIPTSLRGIADQLAKQPSELNIAGTYGNRNMSFVQGMVEIMDIPDWKGDDVSDSNWYLVSDPGKFDTIVMHYWSGYATPRIETLAGENWFYSDTMDVKVSDAWALKVADYRTFFGSVDSNNAGRYGS